MNGKPARRRASRIDDNQPAIVKALRSIPGVKVRSTAAIGEGFPDICVGYQDRNYLFEIKDPAQPLSKRRLTPLEKEFFDTWTGQVAVVETIDEVLAVIFPAQRNARRD